MISRLTGGPIRPELCDDYPEDGDEEESVGGEQEEHGAHIDPLMTGGLHEGALVVRLWEKKIFHFIMSLFHIYEPAIWSLPECYLEASFVSPPKLCSA